MLLEAMKAILLNCVYGWEQVASTYEDKGGKADLRDKDDEKCHCVEKLYNTVQKPYRESGECIGLYFLLLESSSIH